VRKELKYARMSDEEVMAETVDRLKRMRRLLEEIRDSLKTAGGVE